jgi:two-component system chemotaxis sensor kinase CheA
VAEPVAEPVAAPVAEAAAAPTPFPGRCEPSDQSACGFEPVAIDISPVFESEDGTEESGRRSVADSSIRVDVGLLDQLMRMVGELVLTRNQVVQYVGDLQHTELQRASQRLNLIATELQEGVMKTRMQPIDQVWSRLPRVVRDLGAQVGKQVRLTMDGRETELDRTLLEAVKDPLTHLVRNAIDHGLETPEGRTAAGKPVEGTLSLRAYHEGGQVVVEVGDDGRGIDPARVGAKALENGIVNRDQLQRMSEREIADLVFRPGFSTATAVSNISGRGVGMDVVRTNIEKIGGTVDLVSEVGVGTTVRVRIPLTLAIIPALVVGQAGDTYAIPQANLLELVRLEGEAAMASIEHVAGAPVYRLRGTLLPLVYLDAQLGLPSPEEREALNIVVLAADNTHFGLIVDRILDTQEIVVRPLSRQIKHVEAFAGATITGDGKVALILDVAGLAQRATHQAAAGVTRRNDTERAHASETTRLLICQVGSDRRLALPMTDVARLEEFAVTDVEKAGNAEVVQYRGDLLRLVHVGPLLGMGSGPGDAENYMVVVHRHEDESAVGLVVDRILDVIEEEIALSNVGARRGLAGSAVLQQRVTDIVDVPALVAAAQSA